MNAPESVVAKIRSLSLKTVKNGATESEEKAAKEMIVKLSEKYGFGNKPSAANKNSQAKSSEETIKTFKDSMALGTVEQKAKDIDWDVVAKELLKTYEYSRYVHMTHTAWEAYNKTIRGLQDPEKRYSLDMYRKHCYKVFMLLHK